jgi:RecA-family ATPase
MEDIDIWDCFENEPPPLDFAFGNMLAGTVGGLVSPGGGGKTFLVMNIATSICAGFDLTRGALQSKQIGKVRYINAEDPASALKIRFHQLGKFLNIDQRRLMKENFTITSCVGEPIWLLDENGNKVQEQIDWLTRLAEGQRLVVLDTLRRVHLADEDKATPMTQLLTIFEGIANQTGASILFTHHTNKSSVSSGNGDMQGASRGSSVITDNARFQLNMSKMTRKEADKFGVEESDRWRYVKLNAPKVNNNEETGEIWLRRSTGGILVKADSFTPKAVIVKNIELPVQEPIGENSVRHIRI